MPNSQPQKGYGLLHGSKIVDLADEDRPPDYEFDDPSGFVGTHVNSIPLLSSTQSARHFYGARFFNQAMPLKEPEEALVQALDTSDANGRSFDDVMGERVGALRAPEDLEVVEVGDKGITVKSAETGKTRHLPLYAHFPFNRKSELTQAAVVQPGQRLKKGELLARSNYTTASGKMAMGANARIALVPYKGFALDDAVVISAPFAERLTSVVEDWRREHDSWACRLRRGGPYCLAIRGDCDAACAAALRARP